LLLWLGLPIKVGLQESDSDMSPDLTDAPAIVQDFVRQALSSEAGRAAFLGLVEMERHITPPLAGQFERCKLSGSLRAAAESTPESIHRPWLFFQVRRSS
jgi:hypothetical protein